MTPTFRVDFVLPHKKSDTVYSFMSLTTATALLIAGPELPYIE